jgi:hypothetical protein
MPQYPKKKYLFYYHQKDTPPNQSNPTLISSTQAANTLSSLLKIINIFKN